MRVWGVFVLGLILAACLLPARQFALELPGRPGVVEPLPVTLEDRTGLVQAVGPAQPGQLNIADGIGLGEDPSVLVVSWTGGACDRRSHLVFAAANDGYTITESTDRDGTCDDIGVLRTVTLGLASAIDPAVVRLSHDPAAP